MKLDRRSLACRRLIASPLDPTRTEESIGDLHTWRLEDNG
jgi:hypothetical protein